MNIAFIHYHLKHGGVTTVIRRQVDMVQSFGSSMVLTGEPPEAPFPADIAVIQGLGYDGTFSKHITADEVAESVIDAIYQRWPEGCDVLHVHNPLLAKNRLFPEVLRLLQQHIPGLFLQVHDFAEDGRPGAYYARVPYPADCHYGVINTRDFDRLKAAGLKESGLHLVPNQVGTIERTAPAFVDRLSEDILYPVRGIRRKNIGEAILLNRIRNRSAVLRITQPPNSTSDIAAYHGWKNFVEEQHLPVVFEAGVEESFPDLVAASRFLVTTSITEGFGFAFLEPWTAEKAVLGRLLPDICVDFQGHGVRLDHLYARLDIPLDWIDRKRFRDRWHTAVAENSDRFGLSLDAAVVASAWQGMIADDCVDFGLLDEKEQKRVILSVGADGASAGSRILERNPNLRRLDLPSVDRPTIVHNRETVMAAYGWEASRTRLLTAYDRIRSTSACQRIDKKKLLSRFFHLPSFSLLKWGEYHG